MDYILLIATLTLLSQIGVFVLLYASFQLKKMGRYREKGILMTAGVILHLIVIFVIMVPSFLIGLVPQIVKPPIVINTFLVPVHVVTGTIAAALGAWIVATWRFRKSLEFCAPKEALDAYNIVHLVGFTNTRIHIVPKLVQNFLFWLKRS